ncbi:hydroxyisourate hydrolase [Zhouia amylolytica]|uniref:hydroxyisourate hydrolase n=1 Tax=Zhouia amylolytica TaxID=376730 RepID=UPI0020CD04D7|nr:hydroxyisourate hydrolase [Zhouia amylolytica]MCQ0112749.1 hydroxyisourate hydrolase [Zhouia amylolytica]
MNWIKKFLWIGIFLLVSITNGQTKNFQLSTHVLDITEGKPDAKIQISLERYEKEHNNWVLVKTSKTDENGRISNFLPTSQNNEGVYKLIFHTKPYFKNKGVNSFYPYIEIPFEINDQSHYHVPITVSPFGYSTYRGS